MQSFENHGNQLVSSVCQIQESQANSAANARTDDGVLSGGEGGGAELGAVQSGAAKTGRAPGCQPGGGSLTPERDPGA